MPTARNLISNRQKASATAFVDRRVEETKAVTQRQVFRGTVLGRNPATGEYKVDTGGGRSRWAKSVASSDLNGRSVLVTSSSKIGQIAEMPGFN